MTWTVNIFETSSAGRYPLKTREMPNYWGMKPSRRMLVIQAKRMSGMRGVPCEVIEDTNGELTITSKKLARCVIVTKKED